MTLLDFSQVPISRLKLPTRIYNVLERNQIDSIEKLLDYSRDDLLELKGFGKCSEAHLLKCLKAFLSERGITIKAEDLV